MDKAFEIFPLAEEHTQTLVHARRAADKDARNFLVLQLVFKDLFESSSGHFAAAESGELRAERGREFFPATQREGKVSRVP